MLATTFGINEFAWIPGFLTFWGYFISWFSVFASMKASRFYEWQVSACILTEVGHALNLLIMPLFWIYLWPGISKQGWHKDTWQTMMHMITLHSVPFVSTTINIAVSEIKILREDTTKVMKAGVVYVFCNICGQFYYGVPLYQWSSWVDSPIESAGYCTLFILVSGLMYYLSSYGIDAYAKWLVEDEENDEDEIDEI